MDITFILLFKEAVIHTDGQQTHEKMLNITNY